MASEQATTNDAIAKAVAEVTRVAIQAMTTTATKDHKAHLAQDRWTCNETTKLQLGGRQHIEVT